jgi:hypothetical protein
MAQRAKAAVMSIASNDKPTMVEKLWGKQPSHGSLLSYASADASVTGSLPDTKAQNPMLGGSPPYDKQTAVYDISARAVYLPNGSKLEAHSGLGPLMDDLGHVNERNAGATPPNIYDLKPREKLFHGVPALRMTPVEIAVREVVLHSCIDKQQCRVERHLCGLERSTFEQQRMIPLGEGSNRLIHHATAHADVIVLGAIRHARNLTGRQRGAGERCDGFGCGDGQRS